MTLRFGIFDHMEPRRSSLGQLYRERLELLEQADRAGFFCYHKAEHHLTPLDRAPSPNVFLAAAAERTERIRLGPLVYLLPFYHPIRLIEEICMLDHLSGGRLEVGVGRGISPPEHMYWGHDPEEGRARSEETLAVVLRGLTHPELSYDGDFYRFREVPMLFKPVQLPYPPLWYPGNVEFAARHGMNTVLGGPIPHLAKGVARYRELSRGRRPEHGLLREPLIGAARHIFVAGTDREALARARESWSVYHSNLTTLFRAFGLEPQSNPTLGGDFDRALEVQAAVVGCPATVRSHVAQFAAESGCNYFVGAFAWGNLTHEQSLDSLELFAKEVLPHFGDAAAAS